MISQEKAEKTEDSEGIDNIEESEKIEDSEECEKIEKPFTIETFSEPSTSTSSTINKSEEIEATPSTSKENVQPFNIIHDINEYDFGSDWESDIEIVEPSTISQPKPKTINLPSNPAINYMKEYSNLNQEQIFSLIQQARKNQAKEEKAKNNETFMDKNKNSSNSLQVSEKKTSQITEIVSDIYTSMSPICHDKFLNNQQKDNKVISSSESDDDFVEVEDEVPKQTNKIEITVNFNEKIENDIFADIFENHNIESRTHENSVENILKMETNDVIVQANSLKEKSENDNLQIENEKTTSDIVEEKTDNQVLKKIIPNLNKESSIIAKVLEINDKETESKEEEVEIVEPSDNEVPIETDSERNTQEIEVDSLVTDKDLMQDEKISKPEPIVLPIDEKELQSMKVYTNIYCNKSKNF